MEQKNLIKPNPDKADQNINQKLNEYNPNLGFSEYDDFMRSELGILDNLHEVLSSKSDEEISSGKEQKSEIPKKIHPEGKFPTYSVKNTQKNVLASGKNVLKKPNVAQGLTVIEKFFMQAFQRRDTDTLYKVNKIRQMRKKSKVAL